MRAVVNPAAGPLGIAGAPTVTRHPRVRSARRGVGALVAALAVVTALLLSGSALAAGGTSIAGAPVIRPGVSQTANTNTDATLDGASRGPQAVGCWVDFEYWLLPLSAGQRVEIQGAPIPPMTDLELGIFPPGTTDANIAAAQPTLTGFPTGGHSLSFTAAASGNYVVVGGPNCYNSDGGPFSFEVAVSHATATVTAAQAVTVALPSLAHIPVSGAITVTVRTVQGAAVSDPNLQLKLFGSWKSGAAAPAAHLLGVASATHGTARFSYHLDAALAGKTIVLHVAAATAAGFKAAASATLTAKVS
jgi:hypothetical protein